MQPDDATALEGRTESFSTPLPHAQDTQIHVRLTTRAKNRMLLVTTKRLEDGDGLAPLGSFVYAIPDRFNPGDALCTPLYVDESSLEFATRLARLLVKRTGQPAYVGSSLQTENMGLGGTVEEMLDAFQAVAGPLRTLLPEGQANGV